MPDHVHTLILIPPKFLVLQWLGSSKARAHFARVYGEIKRHFASQGFRARGYFFRRLDEMRR
jgi:REP element-mobilizing transposase RayT